MVRPKARTATIPERRVVAGPGDVVDICAGPGGMDMGARILGLPPMVGVELDMDACETGRAAGFRRVQADMRELAPSRHRGVTGAVLTPPCPGFSESGKRLGRRDMQTILDAITCFGAGCGCEWPDLASYTEDFRSKLVVECARWVLTAPDLEWFLCEQVPSVMPIWEDITAEAYFETRMVLGTCDCQAPKPMRDGGDSSDFLDLISDFDVRDIRPGGER